MVVVVVDVMAVVVGMVLGVVIVAVAEHVVDAKI